MNLRVKMLLLLLGTALIPLLFQSGAGREHLRKLGNDVAQRSREVLTDLAGQSIRDALEAHAAMIIRDMELLELVVLAHKKEVELLLAKEPELMTRVWYAKDFEDPAAAPDDLAPSNDHVREDARGLPSPMLVSLTRASFRLPPGTPKEDLFEDILRLAPMSDFYRAMYERYPESLYWQYTSLENGLHIAFPGHGGYPDEFDPRQRDWYVSAVQRDHLTWRLTADATTGLVTYSVSIPVRRPDGSVAGVTAIDVPVAATFDDELLPAKAIDAAGYLVGIFPGDDEFSIFAEKGRTAQRANWQDMVKMPKLVSDDMEEYRAMVEDIRAGRAGRREMAFNEVPCLWVYQPVDDDGEAPTAIVMVAPLSAITGPAQEAASAIQAYTEAQAWNLRAVLILSLAGVLVIGLFTSHKVTRPMIKLAESWKRLAQGDFSVRINMRLGDERGKVIKAFNETVPMLERHMKTQQDLKLAEQVQQSLLPKSMPELPGVEVAGKSLYCDETGGDYLDVFMQADGDAGYLSVLVGDISGHGVASALLMTSARALFRSAGLAPGKLGEQTVRVNRLLSADIGQTGNFLTMFLMVLDQESRTLHWVRAGHDPASLYDPDTDSFTELKGEGVSMGWCHLMECEYEERTVAFDRPGQIVAVGTDGIWETTNPEGEMFGRERFHQVIRENASKSPQEIMEAVFEAVHEFRGDGPREDDITLAVMKRTEEV